MHLIVGLGNPGDEYRQTRHNLGYELLDALCRRNACRKERREARCLVRPCRMDDEEALLARTGTYMNVSGAAVRRLMDARGIAIDHALVAYDDVDLELGRIKLQSGGGAAGHRGMRSLIAAMGDPGFARLRMGIGRPPEGRDMADWVLETFRRSERATMESMVSRAAEAAEDWVRSGLRDAMNRANPWPQQDA